VSINDLQTGDERRSPFRRFGFVAAVGFLGLVVVLGIYVSATHGSGKVNTAVGAGPSVGSGPSPTAAQPSATSSSDARNACGLTDTDQTAPTSTPPDITWQLWQGVAVPTSSTAGPGKTDGAIAGCYAHTPLGALLAVSQIGPRLGVANRTQAMDILKQQAMPGPGVDKDLSLISSGAPIGDDSASGQLAGFQFVSYTPDSATINLVDKMPNGTFNTATFAARWTGEDWKIVIQDDGTDSSSVSQVSSLSGYVPWGGIS
jgi:hypothetical protein